MTGRPNRFVSFLGILDLGRVGSRRAGEELVAVTRANEIPGCIDGDASQHGRIGTHVSNVAVLIEPLRGIHRAPRGESQLANRFLLQRASRERWLRPLGKRLLLDRGDTESLALQSGDQIARGLLAENHQFVRFRLAGLIVEVVAVRNSFAVDRNEVRLETRLGYLREFGDQIPIGCRVERNSLALTLYDQSHGNALHPTGRKRRTARRPADFLPQQL